MKIEMENGKIYRDNKFNDPYYRMFLRNNCLRESCYACPSRGLNKRADITLSDFWGVETTYPDLADGGEISLVLLHTDKGRNLFNNICSECDGHEVDFKIAIKGNPAFFKSYHRPEERSKIEEDISRLPFEKIAWKYAYSLKGKIKYLVKKFLGLNKL